MKEDFLRLVEEAAVEALTSRQKVMFFRRYGLTGVTSMTLSEIGDWAHISRERVRQIIDKSVKKISERSQYKTIVDKPSECQKLGAYLKEYIGDSDSPVKIYEALLASGIITESDLEHHMQLALYLTGIAPKSAKETIGNYASSSGAAFKQIQSQERIDQKFERILEGIEWPSNLVDARTKFGKKFDQKRDTNPNEKGLYEYMGSAKAGRPVYYDSRLELSFYKLLEQSSFVEFYAEQPFSIQYRQVKDFIYYPDTYVLLNDGRGIVFEIKPSFLMPLANNLRKFRALKEFCEKEGLGYSMTDMRANFAELRGTKVRSEYKTAVLNAIERQPISWPEYIKIKDAFEPSKEEFIALVVQNELVWRQEPFKLGKQR